MKERMKRCFEKNSVLLFFCLSLKKKNLTNFVCLFFFCFLFFCNKRVKNIKFSSLEKKQHFLLSCVFYHQYTTNHSNQKRKRTKTPKERERESERSRCVEKGGRALPLAISKGCLSSSSFEEE